MRSGRLPPLPAPRPTWQAMLILAILLSVCWSAGVGLIRVIMLVTGG